MEAVDEIKVMASVDEITFYEVDEVLADVSARVAARYRLRGADAVYVAVARVSGSTLITLDYQQRHRAADLVPTMTVPRTGG